MSKSDKRIARLKCIPTDFHWDELCSVMFSFDFEWIQSKAGSSHGHFYNPSTKRKLNLSKPHPSGILKRYQIENVICALEEEGYIESDNNGKD